MKKLFIHHHLGLGDHFVCNALVRHVVETSNFDEYVLVTKKHNIPTVEQMYCDLTNLKLFSVETDSGFYDKINQNGEILRIGFENLNRLKTFDVSFYEQLNIPFEYKKEKFKVCRNKNKEDKCFDFYSPPQDYIFVHSNASDKNFSLKLETDLPIISPVGYDFTLIDYLKLIENANEIHCIDSSFMNMIDLSVEHDNMFFHDCRSLVGGIAPTLVNKWKTISYGDEK